MGRPRTDGRLSRAERNLGELRAERKKLTGAVQRREARIQDLKSLLATDRTLLAVVTKDMQRRCVAYG